MEGAWSGSHHDGRGPDPALVDVELAAFEILDAADLDALQAAVTEEQARRGIKGQRRGKRRPGLPTRGPVQTLVGRRSAQRERTHYATPGQAGSEANGIGGKRLAAG